MEHLSTRANDVERRFRGLPENGVYQKFINLPYYSNIGADHIQGYTQFANGKISKINYIFSHSLSGRDSGRVLINDAPEGKCTEIHTPSGWNHPGGIQAIGKYLFVPCEKDNKSKVFIYDLENTQTKPETSDFNHNAGCLGITDFVVENKHLYLLLVGDKSVYHAYISGANDSEMPILSFESIGSFSLNSIDKKKLDCQGFGLVTDTNGQVYMIALMSHGKGSTYEDWGYLIKINATTTSVNYEYKEKKHFINEGGLSGVDGSHFRWGAGIRITPDGSLVVLATSRNILSEKGELRLNTTYWAN